MTNKFRPLLTLIFFLVTITVSAQVATNTGTIYGKVLDEHNVPLPGVNVQLESDIIPAQSATTGVSGAFRFANLPPGSYDAAFSLQGFTEIKQEAIHITTGRNVDLRITMNRSPAETVEVHAQVSLPDRKKTGTETTYSQDYLEQVPSARDPWALIYQAPGVDSGRFNTGSPDSGPQPQFSARGSAFQNNNWNYDGVNGNFGDGLSPSYYDFEAFEEVQIITGGNDPSIQTGGVTINLVTKRAGNQWAADLSYYFTDESLQSENTPQELIDHPIINPITGNPSLGSNRIHSLHEYGFNAGGPLIKEKLFLWGAYRNYKVDLFSVRDLPDDTTLTNFNAKLNFDWNTSNQSQVGYFKNLRNKSARELFPGAQAPETLWKQSGTPLQGIFTAQHTWIPDDSFLLTSRYGFVGTGVRLIPPGGRNVPMIYLSAIPLYEDTFIVLDPGEGRTHDWNTEANWFKEGWRGGDHEFKFGFEYRKGTLQSFYTYGNGVYIVDYSQTTPKGELITGSVTAQHNLDYRIQLDRISLYMADTYRKDRLALNLGLRLDHQTGRNLPSSVPGVPGFENDVGPFNYSGDDPGIAFNDFSPRLGATFDLTGDAKTILRTNFARYYDVFTFFLVGYSNPTAVPNGAYYYYLNRNGDRNITPDELIGDETGRCSRLNPCYYGGLGPGGFNFDSFLAKKKYDPDLSNSWANEFVLGIERQITSDIAASVSYTYRRYENPIVAAPYGINSSDFIPGGFLDAHTLLGDFHVPYFVLGSEHDGTEILTNVKDYHQTYQGVEFVIKKRMSQNFLLNGSLTLQRQAGHYEGGDSLAFVLGLRPEAVAFDPTNLPFLNDRPYGLVTKGVVYPYSEWSLKISGIYQFPWDLQAGAFLRYQQGYIFALSGVVSDPFIGSHGIFVEPFGSRRFDNLFSIDLNIQKGFEIQKYGRFTFIADLFNLTNANTVLGRLGQVRSQNLNQITEVLSPRVLRLGLRYSF